MSGSEEPLTPSETALLAKYRKRKDWKRKVATRLEALFAGRYAEERDLVGPPPETAQPPKQDDASP